MGQPTCQGCPNNPPNVARVEGKCRDGRWRLLCTACWQTRIAPGAAWTVLIGQS